ncbi:MAG: DUF6687 family protein [Pyrinomonadaceae bacterium]
MRFQFYHAGLENVPKLSVDGTVGNSIHFSHWEGNETPHELRADTSTEIALNLVASPKRLELTRGIELVTNNHFDTDGVLSVWTVLTGERALELRDKLIPAAEAGDFSEFRNEDEVRASIVIQGADQAGSQNETTSLLARQLAGEGDLDDARCYELVLPEVERVLTRTNEFEPLWREGWKQIAAAMDSFERGTSRVEEYDDARLSLISLAPDMFSPAGFSPTRHAAPYMAISSYARGHLFLIAIPVSGGWFYRIDYPYYSWAETVVRPRIRRHDLSPLLSQLNQLESGRAGNWKADNSEMTSAAKFLTPEGELAASKLSPDVVSQTIRAQLLGKTRVQCV